MRLLLRGLAKAMLLVSSQLTVSTDALAQSPERPAAAAPRAREVRRALWLQDSLALARRRALVDSARGAHERRRDSILRAHPPGPARRSARKRSPADGRGPFFGYTWAFYADVVAGALIGFVALLFRERHSRTTLRGWWAVAGSIIGAIGGGFVFLVLSLVAALASVLAFFGEPMSAMTLFALSLTVMLLTAVGVAAER